MNLSFAMNDLFIIYNFYEVPPEPKADWPVVRFSAISLS